MAAASPGNGLESLGPVERMGTVGTGPHQFFADTLIRTDYFNYIQAIIMYVLIKNIGIFSLLCVLVHFSLAVLSDL